MFICAKHYYDKVFKNKTLGVTECNTNVIKLSNMISTKCTLPLLEVILNARIMQSTA